MSGCGAPAQPEVTTVTPSDQAVVSGLVTTAGGAAKARAYVRLLDASGTFVAEVQTSSAGRFLFFAAPGVWTVRVLAARGAVAERSVEAVMGAAAELRLALPAVP